MDISQCGVHRFKGNIPLNPILSRFKNKVRSISQDEIHILGDYRRSARLHAKTDCTNYRKNKIKEIAAEICKRIYRSSDML